MCAVKGDGGDEMNGVDVVGRQHILKPVIAALDARAIADPRQVLRLQIADDDVFDIWMRLVDRHELGPELKADDGNTHARG